MLKADNPIEHLRRNPQGLFKLAPQMAGRVPLPVGEFTDGQVTAGYIYFVQAVFNKWDWRSGLSG